jgi:WD40 repeat protein
MASADRSGTVAIWHLGRQIKLRSLRPYAGQEVRALALHPDGTRLVTAASTVDLWETTTGTHVLRVADARESLYHALAFSAEGREILAGVLSGVVCWRDE